MDGHQGLISCLMTAGGGGMRSGASSSASNSGAATGKAASSGGDGGGGGGGGGGKVAAAAAAPVLVDIWHGRCSGAEVEAVKKQFPRRAVVARLMTESADLRNTPGVLDCALAADEVRRAERAHRLKAGNVEIANRNGAGNGNGNTRVQNCNFSKITRRSNGRARLCGGGCDSAA